MPHSKIPEASFAGRAAAQFGVSPMREGLAQRAIGAIVHFFTYHFVLKRRKATETEAAGFRFLVPPTVFHPRFFLTGEFFAATVAGLDLRGKRVADVGTGAGILALAAARAGASEVYAIDINPRAAWAASENARRNGLGARVTGVCSNLLSGLAARPLFDVVISNPPYFPGEPRDVADRAWHSGPDHRDIAQLFLQARERLASGGRMYVLFSTRVDLALMGALIEQAKFRSRRIASRSILIDTFVIYELEPA
jgi:methylase of polypeptide subunit release factors